MVEHHITGFEKYLSIIVNHLQETAIWTFAELGIADLLAAVDTPQTADELAQKQGWNSIYLYRLLRAVVDLDIVHEIQSDQTIQPEKTNRFELTEDGRFLTSNHPSKCRYFLCWVLHPLFKTASHYLPQLISEGSNKDTGLQRVIGNISPFDFLKKEENQNLAHVFNEAMTGFLLCQILEKYLTIKQGICFDLPNVVQQAGIEKKFEERKISKDRYRFVGGDMFDPKTIPQADAYIMKTIIHDWNNDRAIDILKSIRTAANGQRITIFIVDLIILPETEENKYINKVQHAFDLHMLIVFNGKERTQRQVEYLLEQSGFTFKQLHRTETPVSIIEAVAN